MRIQQSHAVLSEMLDLVDDARVVPAPFQRPYVWKEADVEALFRSLLSGWPIGSFVLWKPAAGHEHHIRKMRLGPIDVEPGEHVQMLLDGQNRLATIAWARNLDNREDALVIDTGTLSDAELRTWCSGRVLCADLETRSIRFFDADEAGSAERIPVGLLIDHGTRYASRALFEWDRRFGQLSDDALNFFGDDIPNAFRSARVSTTTLYDATAAEAREAFVNICRVGVPASIEDIERALSYDVEDTAPSPSI